MTGYLATHGPYLLFVGLAMVAVYILVTHRSLLHAMVGLYLFQSSAILFFILMSMRTGGTLPILPDAGHNELAPPTINPLPHAMMLTAIVVGVATLGVGLALLRRIHDERQNLEDPPAEEVDL